MNLNVAISPCPNDTYIFGAIALGYIDTGIYRFSFEYADIEDLNQAASLGKYDLLKMSYYHYFAAGPDYNALPCGGAIGYDCGPLLITANPENYGDCLAPRVLVPGAQTTANFLLHFYNPEIKNVSVRRFNEIEESLLQQEAEAGVIIHENRFTYQDKGLFLIEDLGKYWQEKTHSPIPLGCIGLASKFSWHDQEKITELIKQSLEYADRYPEKIWEYIRSHAVSMNDEVIKSHIALYVNDFSHNIGYQGRAAIDRMESEINLLQNRP